MNSQHDVREKNISIWEQLYSSGHSLNYPAEMLVRTAHYLFKQYPFANHKRALLDFGFGSGENLLHFAKLGHLAHGVEVSASALNTAKKRFQDAHLEADLKLIEKGKIPHEDKKFDMVIAWEVLYYNNWESLAIAQKEISRVLKPGGLFLGTMTAPGHQQERISTSIGDHLWRIQEGPQSGATLMVIPKDQLSRCFPQEKLSVGQLSWELDNLFARTWIVSYQKLP